MLTLGINLPANYSGKVLKDGGACLVEDGRILVAVSEERLTRKKHTGGYKNAVAYCLDSVGTSVKNVDHIVATSCIDFSRSISSFGDDLPKEKIRYLNSHHLSHAYSAFMVSPFDEAIVVVLDSGGSLLEDPADHDWWKYSREQQSYYVGKGTEISLIGRDFQGPYEAGIGELYRAFTKFLGWESSSHSGNTMALSAYGDPDRFPNLELFYFEDKRLRSHFSNSPNDIEKMMKEYSIKNAGEEWESRTPGSPIRQLHKDLAFLIQSKMEKALIKKIRLLNKRTGIKNLCLAGGVALNCIMNTKILENTSIENIFIQPAAGDQGQCLGNALYGNYVYGGANTRYAMNNTYLGKDYDLSTQAVIASIKGLIPSGVDYLPVRDIARVTARLLSEGKIISWFQGKSEFGPRALGNRSILADPRNPKVVERLNEIKGRESFRPYAPSILLEFAGDYFKFGLESPYMVLADYVKSSMKNVIPAVTHVDDSVRPQTVELNQNPPFHALLTEFHRITGVPVLLNTSMNRRSEPICENITDAFSCFLDTAVDCLVVNNTLFSKKKEGQAAISQVSQFK